MDIFLLITAILLLAIGFIGCVIPALPGPTVSWLALLLVKISRFGTDITWTWIIIFASIVTLVTILDYVIPAWGTKKFGGTRAGTWGATIGLVFGLFFPPVGIILGPFLGAFIAELMAGHSSKHSLKAAFGAFIGFLLGIGFKLIVCAWITIYLLAQLI